MEKKTLVTLEFAKIKAQLAEYAQTTLGQAAIQHLTPASDYATVKQRLTATKEGVDVVRLAGGMAFVPLVSIEAAVKRLRINANLNGPELAHVLHILIATHSIAHFVDKVIQDHHVELPYLQELCVRLTDLPELRQRLSQTVDSNGTILTSASPLLRSLRQQRQTTQAAIKSTLSSFTHGKKAQALANPTVTVRNDRYVLPVRADHKRSVRGIVHDQSASGQTLFIEPQAVVAQNNRLAQIAVEEKSEINRILAECSALLLPYLDELLANQKQLAQLDFINAKARYATAIKATFPHLTEANHVNLRKAWHPLIGKDQAVANDIVIGKDYNMIVITGPNTGGKTITLKTLGIVQCMAQAGLFIPAAEESIVGVFADIFADIGDEQSIEQSLSTFSSHMVNIIDILHRSDDRSLVLLDEVGAGTDPKEGASLAMALLNQFHQQRATVLATTHYPELKAYGFETAQTINASMEFDDKTLQPTYRLLLNIPGQSNALKIAERLGMPETVIAAAKQMTDPNSQTLNQMIADLVHQKHAADEALAHYQAQLQQAEQLHRDLKSAFNDWQQQKATLLDRAKEQANELVAKSQRQADQIIADLRKQAHTHKVDEGKLIAAKTGLNALEQRRNLAKNKVLRRAKQKQALHENDDVFVPEYGQHGILVRKLDAKHWEVQIGMLKMKLAENQLEKTQPTPEKPAATRAAVKRTRSAQVAPKLDLRGERYENALTQVDRYLDEAILAGYPSVTIIHGKGSGILRQAITKYLRKQRAVKKFEYAPANAGGNGATIVHFQ